MSSWPDKSAVLLHCSPAFSSADVDIIQRYFEDASVGGQLVPDGIRFIESGQIILEFMSVDSCTKVVSRTTHSIDVCGSRHEVNVERCPLSLATKLRAGVAPTTDCTEDDGDSFLIAPNIVSTDDTQKTSDVRHRFDEESINTENDVTADFLRSPPPPGKTVQEEAMDVSESNRSEENYETETGNETKNVSMDTREADRESHSSRPKNSHSVEREAEEQVMKRIKIERDVSHGVEPVRENEQNFAGPRSDVRSSPSTTTEDSRAARTVQVLDVPSDDFDILELHLESEKTGGGEVESFLHDKDNHVSVVIFADEKVAENFLRLGTIHINGNALPVARLPKQEKPDERSEEIAMETVKCKEEEEEVRTTTSSIEVKGVKTKLTKDILLLYFENKKRSGGSKIAELDLVLDEETAVITFQDADVAARVVERGPHRLAGLVLECRLVETGNSGPSRSCAIEVCDLVDEISEQMLTLFFENRKRSGGGQVDEIFYKTQDHRAVVTFRSADVVQRILQNHLSSPLSLGFVRLSISELRPVPSPTVVEEEGDRELDKLIVKRIPEDSNRDDLQRFIQRASGTAVTRIRYSMRPGIAMVEFEGPHDYRQLRELVCTRPFRDSMISIHRVQIPSSIQVFNVGHVTSDHLVLFFENAKCGGEEVVKVIHPDDSHAILYFADRYVIPTVLSKEREIDGRTLQLSVYYEDLGVMPPDVDDSRPTWWLPPDLTVRCSLRKVQFVRRCSKTRSNVAQVMENVYCQVVFPEKNDDDDNDGVDCDVVLRCTLVQRTRNVGELARTWAATCVDAFHREMDEIFVEDFNVLRDIWNSVVDEMKSSLHDETSEDEDVWTTVDDGACSIRVVGARRDCEKLVDVLRSSIAQAEDRLEREKQKISERLTTLKPHQVLLLKLTGLLDSGPGDDGGGVEVVVKDAEVILVGHPGSIVAKKLKLFEVMAEVVTERVELPDFVLDSLKLGPFRSHVGQCLKERSVAAVWDLGPKGLNVHACSRDDIDATLAVMKSEIVQRVVELDAASSAATRLPRWTELRQKLHDDYSVFCVAEDRSTVTLTSARSSANAIVETVVNFIRENTVNEEFLQTERGKAAIVSAYMTAELRQIQDDFRSCLVSIEERLDAERAGFVVRGTVHGLKSALDKVVELLDRVLEQDEVLDRPGMSYFLRSSRGRKMIESIQNRCRVHIEEWQDVGGQRPSSSSSVRRPRSSSDRNEKVVAEIKVAGSIVVKVVLGDITDYKVDAIVNAANGKLDHIGGVALSIVEKGGSEIQTECREYVRANGDLLPGQLYVSKPGRLSCKHVIHAVGPMWQRGEKNEENVLYETVYNILERAETLKLGSVALPAISTGIYGFPLNKAAKQILEGIEDFVDKESLYHLNEICLIDNNEKVTKQFKDLLLSVFPGSQNQLKEEWIVIDDDVGLKKSLARRKESDDKNGVSSSVAVTSKYDSPTSSIDYSSLSSVNTVSSKSKVSGNVLTTPEDVTITLVKGSIVQQAVDVIVNSTAQNLVLSNGAVSNLILQTAGAGIQAECQQMAPKGVAIGEVVVTGGYNLSCQSVYHGSCCAWDNDAGPCEQSVRGLLKAAFNEASRTGMTSIAVPAIGTGNLKIPHAVVAKLMYDEAELFSSANPNTSLTDILFVVYDKDLPTIGAFENELKFPSRGQAKKKMPGRRASDRVLVKTLKSGDRGESSKQSNESSDNGGAGGWSIVIGKVTLEVLQGDITVAKTDAIVNSTNDSMRLDMGEVSLAILKKGGQKIQDECNRIGKMKDGMAVTSAGDLPSKKIFHLKAHSTERQWKKSIEGCLAEAERQRLASITFPLLGTGNKSATVQTMASVMLDSVSNFSMKSHPKHLTLIRISIFQPAMVKQFADVIDVKAREQQSTGFFSKVQVYIKSFFGVPDNPTKKPENKKFEVQELVAPKDRIKKYEEKFRFTIYAESDRCVASSLHELDELCNDVIKDKVLDHDSQYGDIIKNLTDDQVTTIQALENKYPVKITIERGQRVNRLRLQGDEREIASALDEVYSCFHELQKEEFEKHEAEIIAQQAQWMYQCDETYDAYPVAINSIIEKAYQANLLSVEWEEENNDGQFRLDFDKMEEVEVDNTKNKVKVKRVTSESTIPKSWDTMNADEFCKKILLSPNSQEFRDVYKNMTASSGATVNQVLSIERIQNPSMYKQYVVRRDAMQRLVQGTAAVQCERILWHGTSFDTVESINLHGFNRSYCGKNAIAYGRGVYFAQQFAYSAHHTYAVPDANGQKYVYQSRVLAGQFVVGHTSYIVPPLKSGSTVTAERYDSVVDNVTNPNIFVVFTDTQAYPEYLIIFK